MWRFYQHPQNTTRWVNEEVQYIEICMNHMFPPLLWQSPSFKCECVISSLLLVFLVFSLFCFPSFSFSSLSSLPLFSRRCPSWYFHTVGPASETSSNPDTRPLHRITQLSVAWFAAHWTSFSIISSSVFSMGGSRHWIFLRLCASQKSKILRHWTAEPGHKEHTHVPFPKRERSTHLVSSAASSKVFL